MIDASLNPGDIDGDRCFAFIGSSPHDRKHGLNRDSPDSLIFRMVFIMIIP
jgi:hypothetical protein